jgi:hypothetical protein
MVDTNRFTFAVRICVLIAILTQVFILIAEVAGIFTVTWWMFGIAAIFMLGAAIFYAVSDRSFLAIAWLMLFCFYVFLAIV